MSSEHNNIERAAAGWLARSEAGLSAAEKAQLAAWLDADARHAESYRALQRSWARLDGLRGSSWAVPLEAELAEGRGVRRTAIWPWVSGALAASVVWLAAYVGWWRPAQVAAPHSEAATTAVGATRTLTLPDGSTIQLNTNTAVEVAFTRAERRVKLARGEALFKIAKNPARPFIVSAAGVDVRAVGTEFNVRLRDEALEVTVREGKVRVDDGGSGETLLAPRVAAVARNDEPAREVLPAGHRVLIPVSRITAKPEVRSTAPASVPPLEIERSLAWQNGRLVFESAPLSAIVAEFNRYNRRPLVIDDAELAARRFGGTFVANDPDTFLELLRASYGVVTEERAGEIGLRARR